MEAKTIESVTISYTCTRLYCDDKLKRSCRRVKILMSWFDAKSTKSLLQFELLSTIHLTSTSWYPALTKKQQNRHDSVPLKGLRHGILSYFYHRQNYL